MAAWAKIACLALGLTMAGPAAAQLGGLPLDVGRLPGPLAPATGFADDALKRLDPRALADLRLQRLADIVRRNPRDLDRDALGNPIVRAQVLATSPSAESLAIAEQLGFRIIGREEVDGLGIQLVTLQAPDALGAAQALARLRRADPTGAYDLNHLYAGAGPARPDAAGPGSGARDGVRIGVVDTGMDAAHPALAKVKVEGRGFAPGGYKAAAHGLSVASLAARSGAQVIYSADIYGAGPTGGSADAVVKALGWLSQTGVPVINMSIVGPANRALESAITALSRKGVLIVAPVGNDGAAAPPPYPASYPQVVSVTGVDQRGRVLIEAGRALHVDFAAPAELPAAKSGGGDGLVRGTSFAAPIVAAKLAGLRRGGATSPVDALGRQARDVGPKGPDKIYGRGLVGEEIASLATR